MTGVMFPIMSNCFTLKSLRAGWLVTWAPNGPSRKECKDSSSSKRWRLPASLFASLMIRIIHLRPGTVARSPARVDATFSYWLLGILYLKLICRIFPGKALFPLPGLRAR